MKCYHVGPLPREEQLRERKIWVGTALVNHRGYGYVKVGVLATAVTPDLSVFEGDYGEFWVDEMNLIKWHRCKGCGETKLCCDTPDGWYCAECLES